MTEMVKRVAEFVGITEDQARAAITAMREPTAEMITKGYHSITGVGGPRPDSRNDEEKVRDVWPAMIDAALAESD